MTLPGTTVVSRESPPSSSAEIATGTLFVVGLSDRGPVDEAVLVRNLAQFTDRFGDRVAYGLLYDTVDVFFREGGSRAYIGRVVGPTPVTATATLTDGAANTLRVDASSPGGWGNNLSVAITHTGSDFQITVLEDDVQVEQSPLLANNAAAIAWAEANSRYLTLTDLGGGDPAVATTDLATGADDRAAITEDEWLAALDLFEKHLGPGQVAAPGRTTATSHANLLAHARVNNRVALLDLADSPDADTLIAAAATDRALDDARFGAAFAPWAVVPGVASGTTRTVPWSAVQAGMIARLESSGKTSNVPAAGVNGQSQYAVGLSQVGWSDADRESLNDGGVNVVIQRGSDIRTYGYRTLVDPATPEWIWFGNARLYMQIASDLNAVGERFVLAEIDGRGKIIHEFGGELIAALIPYWEAGSLYGENATDAFRVDIGSQVNTPETIAAGELHAVAEVRMSPDAERVQIEVVKIANTEAV